MELWMHVILVGLPDAQNSEWQYGCLEFWTFRMPEIMGGILDASNFRQNIGCM